jgi:DNA polymerase-1
VSGRWACQAPNLMNLPRPENDPSRTPTCVVCGCTAKEAERTACNAPAHDFLGVRSVYIARPGYRLVAFDMKQLEMRMAAYASGDPAMIKACESSDLHAANAEIIFAEAFTTAEGGHRKALRTLAKSSGFAVCYMAQAATVFARLVAAGVDVKLRQVEAMLSRMRRAFAAYYSWQSDRLLDCVRTGYVYSPILGRRRWLGHDPSPTEAANFPIQGGAADLMNLRLPLVVERLAAECLEALLVAQVHDSAVFEVPEALADKVAAVCQEVAEAPIVIDSSGNPLAVSFPIDLEISERWH